MDIQDPDIQRIVQESRKLSFQRWRAQAKLRGEAVEMTERDWNAVWGDLWFKRGRSIDSWCLSRKDWTKPWSKDNCLLMQRREHFSTRSFKKRQRDGDASLLGRKPVDPMEKF
jgi:hypothetical protein